jgi:MPBQ/MSBQ methyltransferase
MSVVVLVAAVRILARDYGFAVTGVTIQSQTSGTGKELTPPDVNARFLVDDASGLSFPDESFDVVWSIEARHICRTKPFLLGNYCEFSNQGGVLVVDGLESAR